jgi:hypothetical protein
MTVNVRILTREKREVPMKRHLMPAAALVTVLVLVLFAPATAFSQLSEGFEGGSIPNTWTFSGPVGLDGTAQAPSGITPTEGSYYGWISNGCSGAAGTTCPTFATQPTPSFSSLGLTAGPDLGTPSFETVLTSPSFTLTSPGGLISFDVNFITTDGSYTFADFALVQLAPSDGSPINLFVANTTNPLSAAVPPVELSPGVATISPATAFFAGTTVTFGATIYGNVPKFGTDPSCEPSSAGPNAPCPGGPTGWMHVTYSAPAGTYTLRFMVSHLTDTGYPSALAIDNVVAQTLESETQILQPGVQSTYTFKNDKYKITPSPYSVGNESLTITAVPILKSNFIHPANFPNETCVPFADYSAANGADTCVGFQADCSFNGVPNGGDCATLLYQLLESYDLPPDLPAIGGPDLLVVHGSGCPTSNTAVAQSIFTDYFVTRIDPTTKGGGSGTGSCFEVTYTPGAPLITSGSTSRFVGFESPVVDTELNTVKAGSTRPLKFQWFDNLGNPVTNLTWCANTTGTGCTAPWVNLEYFSINCTTDSQLNTAADVSSPGNSGFQNLGGGNYQMNWKTQKSWAGSCATVQVTFDNGVMLIPAVGFKFK